MNDWQRFKDGKVWMRINNEEEYDSFAKRCDADALYWNSFGFLDYKDGSMSASPVYEIDGFGGFPVCFIVREHGVTYTGIVDNIPENYVEYASSNMEKVAEMLGVKLGEKFKVDGRVYCFSEDGLVDRFDRACATVLAGLLTGEYTIEKLPWKPQCGDKYWVVLMNERVVRHYWSNDYTDFAMYYAGNCFATEEEALAHAPEIIGKLRRKYEEG